VTFSKDSESFFATWCFYGNVAYCSSACEHGNISSFMMTKDWCAFSIYFVGLPADVEFEDVGRLELHLIFFLEF